VAGCCKCGDEHSGSCATELVITCGWKINTKIKLFNLFVISHSQI
jgi:hypothetical protein